MLWLLLSAAVSIAATSVTISRGTIFETFRGWCRVQSDFAAKLVTCSYCVSHWLAGVAATMIDGPIRTAYPAVSWFANAMLLVGLSVPLVSAITRLLSFTALTDEYQLRRLRTLLAQARSVIAEKQRN